MTGLVDGAGGNLSRKGKRTWFESSQKMTVPNLWSLTTWKRCERKAVGRLFRAYDTIVIAESDMWPIRIKYRPLGSLIWDVRANGVEW